MPREQVEAIGRWAVEHGIWVVADEIYEHLTYDGATAESMPVVVPELADTCVVVNGVAKTYAMTGWRVGWLIGPADVVKAATNLQSHATSNVANVSQRAAIAALEGDLTAVDEMKVAFDRRRRRIVEMLNEIDGVLCPEPKGAFYVYPSVKGLLGREVAGRTATTTNDPTTGMTRPASDDPKLIDTSVPSCVAAPARRRDRSEASVVGGWAGSGVTVRRYAAAARRSVTTATGVRTRYSRTKSRMSCDRRSLCVSGRPCGAPSYTSSRAPSMSAADRAPPTAIGTNRMMMPTSLNIVSASPSAKDRIATFGAPRT